jgi:hypothetical protein
MRYEFTSIEFINNADEIASYYASIERVMQKVDFHAYKNLLIKQNGWVAVCAYEGFGGENMFEVLTDPAYSCGGLKSVTWDMLEPIVLKIQPTEKGIQEFFYNRLGWTILFAGNPDWMILFPAPEDFWLIAGKPDFVEKILGSSIDEGFASFDALISGSRYLTDKGREYYSRLVHQLREIYPNLKVGEAADFDFTES